MQAKLCGLIVTDTSLLVEKAGARPGKAPEGEFVILVPEQALGGRSVHRTSSNVLIEVLNTGCNSCSLEAVPKRMLRLSWCRYRKRRKCYDSKFKSHAASFGLQGFSRCCRHLAERLCHLEQ